MDAMDDEGEQEQIVNCWEVAYMVETLLMSQRNKHLSAHGAIIGLLRVAIRLSGASTDNQKREQFFDMMKEMLSTDIAMLCPCDRCIEARATARERLKRDWELEIPPDGLHDMRVEGTA